MSIFDLSTRCSGALSLLSVVHVLKIQSCALKTSGVSDAVLVKLFVLKIQFIGFMFIKFNLRDGMELCEFYLSSSYIEKKSELKMRSIMWTRCYVA